MTSKAILYFICAIILTAVFSYSLYKFLPATFLVLTLKTMLIPCFTWTALIILSYAKLDRARWRSFMLLSGWICMIGSALLVPGGIYNFMSSSPAVSISVISVIACVLVMSVLYYRLLPSRGLSRGWWWAFNFLIVVNMTLFYLSTKL